MYCTFSAVSSNVVDVISILVSEIMVMNIAAATAVGLSETQAATSQRDQGLTEVS